MPPLGVNAAWGAEQWSSVLIEGLQEESALLRGGVTPRVRAQHRPSTQARSTRPRTASPSSFPPTKIT